MIELALMSKVGRTMISVIGAFLLQRLPQLSSAHTAHPTPPVCPLPADPILEHLRTHPRGELRRWSVIESVEPDRGGARAELRNRRSVALHRLEALIRSGAVERVGRHHVRLSAGTVVEPAGQPRLPCIAAE